MAKIRGEWREPEKEARVVGQYIHAWVEGTVEQFKERHPEIFTKKGELYSSYKFADEMIDTLRRDAFCMFALEGQKEVPLTAEFAGAIWKIRMDVYNPAAGRFVDVKTTKSITEQVWSPELWKKTSFIEAYKYPLQMAIYAEIERRATGRQGYLEPLIVAVSKETPPDKMIISLNDPKRFQIELADIEIRMPRILAIKSGEVDAARCERCAYCRSSKQLSQIVYYKDLEE